MFTPRIRTLDELPAARRRHGNSITVCWLGAAPAACHIDERQRLTGSSSTRATEESVNGPERQSYLMCFVTSSSCLGRHLHLRICSGGVGVGGVGVRLHLPWLRSACQLLLVTVEEPEQRSITPDAGAPPVGALADC